MCRIRFGFCHCGAVVTLGKRTCCSPEMEDFIIAVAVEGLIVASPPTSREKGNEDFVDPLAIVGCVSRSITVMIRAGDQVTAVIPQGYRDFVPPVSFSG